MRSSGYLRALSFVCVLTSGSASLAQDIPSWSGIPDGRSLTISKTNKLPNGFEAGYGDVAASNFQVVSGINIRNGNFAVTYEMADGWFDLVYNSRSGQKGIFGVGWGSPFETRLIRMRDGTIFLRTNGTGAIVTLPPASGISKYADMMDDVIAKEAANSPAGSQAKIHARLQNDQEYALFMALKYNALGSIPSDIGDYELRTIATGSFPVPNCDKGGSLMVQQNGYNLVCGDVAYRFYEDGMLRQGFTGNIGIFKLTYDENRKLIGASNGIKNLKFTWGASGIEKIAVRATYEAEKEEVLTHGPRGELTSLHYPNGLSYKFSYNANLDMTAIAYDDGTTETLTYDEDDRVTSRRRRNGDVTVFRYEDRIATCFNYVTTMHKSAGDPGGRAFVFRLAQGPQRGKPCQDTALELVPD